MAEYPGKVAWTLASRKADTKRTASPKPAPAQNQLPELSSDSFPSQFLAAFPGGHSGSPGRKTLAKSRHPQKRPSNEGSEARGPAAPTVERSQLKEGAQKRPRRATLQIEEMPENASEERGARAATGAAWGKQVMRKAGGGRGTETVDTPEVSKPDTQGARLTKGFTGGELTPEQFCALGGGVQTAYMMECRNLEILKLMARNTNILERLMEMP